MDIYIRSFTSADGNSQVFCSVLHSESIIKHVFSKRFKSIEKQHLKQLLNSSHLTISIFGRAQ